MPKRQRDIQGLGLAMLNRIAGSKALEALKLKKPTEQALYQASKTGFKVAGMAGRQFKSVKDLLGPARMEKSGGHTLFDLTPTDEQTMVVESVQRFAADMLRPATADAETHCEVSEDVWKGAFELGLCMMAVPEALGGAGTERSPVSSALIAEALGHGDMGQAVALMAPIGVAQALSNWGSAEQQAKYLAAFAQDNPPDAAIALLEPALLGKPNAPSCRGARLDDGSWLLNGEKSLVPLAAFADLLVVSVDLEQLGPRLVLLEGNAVGLKAIATPAMGLRAASLGRLSFKDVKVSEAAVLGDEKSLNDAVALGRLAWCAVAVGAAQAVLDYVIPYVNERKAFGEPVSHRQGVAFTIANMGIAVDAMRLMVWRAASRAEHGEEFVREALLAHRYCAEKAMQVGSDGVQMLGGHGFVKEHPVERWYRDLRAVGMMEGGLLL